MWEFLWDNSEITPQLFVLNVEINTPKYMQYTVIPRLTSDPANEFFG